VCHTRMPALCATGGHHSRLDKCDSGPTLRGPRPWLGNEAFIPVSPLGDVVGGIEQERRVVATPSALAIVRDAKDFLHGCGGVAGELTESPSRLRPRTTQLDASCYPFEDAEAFLWQRFTSRPRGYPALDSSAGDRAAQTAILRGLGSRPLLSPLRVPHLSPRNDSARRKNKKKNPPPRRATGVAKSDAHVTAPGQSPCRTPVDSPRQSPNQSRGGACRPPRASVQERAPAPRVGDSTATMRAGPATAAVAAAPGSRAASSSRAAEGCRTASASRGSSSRRRELRGMPGGIESPLATTPGMPLGQASLLEKTGAASRAIHAEIAGASRSGSAPRDDCGCTPATPAAGRSGARKPPASHGRRRRREQQDALVGVGSSEPAEPARMLPGATDSRDGPEAVVTCSPLAGASSSPGSRVSPTATEGGGHDAPFRSEEKASSSVLAARRFSCPQELDDVCIFEQEDVCIPGIDEHPCVNTTCDSPEGGCRDPGVHDAGEGLLTPPTPLLHIRRESGDYWDQQSSHFGDLSNASQLFDSVDGRRLHRRPSVDAVEDAPSWEVVDEGVCSPLDLAPKSVVEGGSFAWSRGELIGRGSLGTVWKALDQLTGRLMAVKEVSLDAREKSDNQFRMALQNEVDLYKDLQHPNIVSYLGNDFVGGALYIYLEYMPGGSLSQVLSQFGPLDEALAARYTRQIVEGLMYLHTREPLVLHRDIKGANILVGMHSTVKLSDFGCSKRSAGTAVHTLRGSVPWMAPEVMRQSVYGRKADIWSCGCVLIEMTTASHPWGRFENCLAAMVRIAMSEETPPVPEQLSGLGRDFVEQCTRRAPEERPDASQLLAHEFLAVDLNQ